MRLILMTCMTMIAFASNSVLTRWAVDGGHIDPSSFAVIRVLAGAVVLCIIVMLRQGKLPLWRRSRIVGVISLSAYMVGFSLAYLTLDAGLGALILFGVVQMTMFFHGMRTGAGPSGRQMSGAGLAFVGLLLALWPGPGGAADLVGASFMIAAGVGWGVYSIVGRGGVDPLASTAANFLLCLPVMAILLVGVQPNFSITGLALAVLCGGLTSGLGYAMWYAVLPRLSNSTAAIVQLSVPILAIFAGALILNENIAALTIIAAALVLGGIMLAITSRSVPADRS